MELQGDTEEWVLVTAAIRNISIQGAAPVRERVQLVQISPIKLG